MYTNNEFVLVRQERQGKLRRHKIERVPFFLNSLVKFSAAQSQEFWHTFTMKIAYWLSWCFYPYNKTSQPKAAWRERGLFHLILPGSSSSLREVRARTQTGQESGAGSEAEPGRMLLLAHS